MKNNTTDRTIQHAQWLIPLVAMLLMSVTTFGQHMVGRAPSQVAVGEQFRLTYTVNTDDVTFQSCHLTCGDTEEDAVASIIMIRVEKETDALR